MSYDSLRACILDLEKQGMLLRIKEEVDPDLEMAEIHRRIFRSGGPAIFYENVKGSPFSAVSNLFGTLERARFIFRDSLEAVKDLVRVKADPSYLLKHPSSWIASPSAAFFALPWKVSTGPCLDSKTTIDKLPQIKSWPKDGGPFILLPQVFTQDPDCPGIFNSNLGMYRIQLSGNQYAPGRQIGLHYQIRRDIGIHHAKAIRRGEKMRVSIFVGGPPAHTFSAVMYLPEGLSELHFAGALARRNFRYTIRNGFVISTDADFCITGWVDPEKTLPEGPFGDHLGYYSLQHAFPFMEVESVYHRKDAIWPFTVVGRPPQEDSVFGKLIQEIAGPMIPKEIPGVKAVHAVDDCGVHPLLLAIGSERYTPYQERRPQEILTSAHALLGYGPCSLAKYLMMVAGEDDPKLDIHDVPRFFSHLLERVDWTKDLHFQTSTTMDTLDYSGTGLNQGSKVVMAACGKKIRDLSDCIPADLKLAEGFHSPKAVGSGVLVIQAPRFTNYATEAARVNQFCKEWSLANPLLQGFPLIILTDDSGFASERFTNFLWVTFTRSNPSHDIYGVQSFQEFKHWGCEGPLVIDARIKPHHAEPLLEDPAVKKKVDGLFLPGKSLATVRV